MRIRFFPVLALFAATPLAAQQPQAAEAQGGNTYRSPAGFVLELPAGWTRAPDAAVDEVSRAAGTPSPGLTYEAVFQAGSGQWPVPPFAAIARGAAPDWLTPAEFRRRWTTGETQSRLQANADRADTIRGARVGMRVGAPWWDEGNRAVWVRADVQETDGFTWTVMMLHPAGGWMIILTYYSAPHADEAQVLAQLDEVIRSLRVD